jgi:hypothetical protein
MHRTILALFAFVGMLTMIGCTASTPDQRKKQPAETKSSTAAVDEKEEAEIRAALDELDPEDRKLAEAQKWCAAHSDSRLGSMDKPYKIMIEGQPVFLCCGGCKKEAEKNPQKTLAKVAELKKKTAAEKATP